MNHTNKQYLDTCSVRKFNEFYRTAPAFQEYAGQVYDFLDHMPRHTKLDLTQYDEHSREWILLTFYAFYFEGEHWMHYGITDDYNSIFHH